MKTIAWLSLARAIYAAVSAITFFYVVARLQISEYGVYSICSSVYIIHEFCLREGLENSILKSNINTASINHHSNILILKWLAVLITSSTALYFLSTPGFVNEYGAMLLACLFISALQLPATKHRALALKNGRGPLLAISSILAGAGSCAVAITSISYNLGIFALITQQISYQIISIFVFLLLSPAQNINLGRESIEPDDISKDTIALLPATLLTALSNRADILTLGYFFNAEAVGIYSVIKRLFQIYIDILGSPLEKLSFLKKGNENFYLRLSGLYFVLMYIFFVLFYGLKEILNNYLIKTNMELYTSSFIAQALIILIISSATNTAKSKLITADRISGLTKIKFFELLTWAAMLITASLTTLQWFLTALIFRSLLSYCIISLYSFQKTSFKTILKQLTILFCSIALSYFLINYFTPLPSSNFTDQFTNAIQGILIAMLIPTLAFAAIATRDYMTKKNTN